MFHRLALRVIPQLHAAVTEPDVRKRKRWVMLAPGLVAFLLYRLFKYFLPLSDPLLLFAMSGVLSTFAAYWAYAMGRQESPARIVQTDGLRRLLWVGGWIGFVYGVQLSLLVLALLALFVNYHFLLHPEGPAMMALIISCTAVTRDAFEIGHIGRMESHGSRMVTFPDGGSFRDLLRRDFFHSARWGGAGLAAGGTVVAAYRLGWAGGGHETGSALLVCALAAGLAHGAFLAGQHPLKGFSARLTTQSWWEACEFWIWPCLTFALTYYLVQIGLVMFVLRFEGVPLFLHVAIGGVTAGMMAAYGYCLGARVLVEAQMQGGVPEGLKRCPFVMDILAKTGWVSSGRADRPAAVAQEQRDQPREILS